MVNLALKNLLPIIAALASLVQSSISASAALNSLEHRQQDFPPGKCKPLSDHDSCTITSEINFPENVVDIKVYGFSCNHELTSAPRKPTDNTLRLYSSLPLPAYVVAKDDHAHNLVLDYAGQHTEASVENGKCKMVGDTHHCSLIFRCMNIPADAAPTSLSTNTPTAPGPGPEHLQAGPSPPTKPHDAYPQEDPQPTSMDYYRRRSLPQVSNRHLINRQTTNEQNYGTYLAEGMGICTPRLNPNSCTLASQTEISGKLDYLHGGIPTSPSTNFFIFDNKCEIITSTGGQRFNQRVVLDSMKMKWPPVATVSELGQKLELEYRNAEVKAAKDTCPTSGVCRLVFRCVC